MDLEKLFSYTSATHRATGRTYSVVGVARLQTSRPLNDMDSVVVYRRSNNELWARDEPEFNDGRFLIETHKLPGSMGFDPMQAERSKDAAWERLRYAYVYQQQFVPNQTALVWRVDLGMARQEVTRLRALADVNRVEIERLKAEIEKLKNG